jgi:aspartyl-tRNA(Asn)/glutamyl-tRNA(Gln) amidotransferase subunit C
MITKKDVEYVAALSRLEFSEDEKDKYTEELNVILEYVSQLNELDTEGVNPTYHVMPLTNVLREDEAKPSMERENVLMNAPVTQEGCFKVPNVILNTVKDLGP